MADDEIPYPKQYPGPSQITSTVGGIGTGAVVGGVVGAIVDGVVSKYAKGHSFSKGLNPIEGWGQGWGKRIGAAAGGALGGYLASENAAAARDGYANAVADAGQKKDFLTKLAQEKADEATGKGR